ncbi:MAG: hypothetical protein CM15mP49_18870 [Actinomycetota bacterium]|nr:MAG: hypothetical protein CM15mP49_18870 [Actinomycetota bacterium]
MEFYSSDDDDDDFADFLAQQDIYQEVEEDPETDITEEVIG